MIIDRPKSLSDLRQSLADWPVTALLGPRQCGKSTLAGMLEPDHYFDLHLPANFQALSASAYNNLSELDGVVVIDEAQLIPGIFPVLRVLADRKESETKFLVLGSASPLLVEKTNETLAGRVHAIDLHGFHLWEVGVENMNRHWLRGGFPRAYLAEGDGETMSFRWRQDFIRTFLSVDLADVFLRVPQEPMRRFWTMLAYMNGQSWNASTISKSLGVNRKTVDRYLDVLESTRMVRVLRPWFTNTKKRLRRAPKVFIRDAGLLHALLQIQTRGELLTRPELGASWEGYVIEQILAVLPPERSFESYFYSVHEGSELDLYFPDGFGFEVKSSDAPRRSRSMTTVMQDLNLRHLTVVYPGEEIYGIGEKITVVPLTKIREHLLEIGVLG